MENLTPPVRITFDANFVLADWSRLQQVVSMRNRLAHDLSQAENSVARLSYSWPNQIGLVEEPSQEHWLQEIALLEAEIAEAGINVDQVWYRFTIARAHGRYYEAYHLL